MGWRAGWLCAVVSQFLDLCRHGGNLSGRFVRPAGASRQRHRQGPDGPSCAQVHGEWLGAASVVGARLEHTLDRFLQIARRRDARRMDRRARFRRGARKACGAFVMQIVIIAAVAENDVIGQGGAMPWRLKSDMKHFRALTMGKPVVMGRKTYLSLALKPLPGRTNIVVTRDPAFTAPGVLVAPSLEARSEE